MFIWKIRKWFLLIEDGTATVAVRKSWNVVCYADTGSRRPCFDTVVWLFQYQLVWNVRGNWFEDYATLLVSSGRKRCDIWIKSQVSHVSWIYINRSCRNLFSSSSCKCFRFSHGRRKVFNRKSVAFPHFSPLILGWLSLGDYDTAEVNSPIMWTFQSSINCAVATLQRGQQRKSSNVKADLEGGKNRWTSEGSNPPSHVPCDLVERLL